MDTVGPLRFRISARLQREFDVLADGDVGDQIEALEDETDLLRSSRKVAPFNPVMSVPSISTLPPVGRSSRLMVRTNVDLPAPEKPTMPKISPFPR